MEFLKSLTKKPVVRESISYEDALLARLEKEADRAANIDKVDTVTMDVPLLIRVFELVREDVKTDMDLHNLVERLIVPLLVILIPVPILTPPNVAVVAVVKSCAETVMLTCDPVLVAVIALPTKLSIVVVVFTILPSSLTTKGPDPPLLVPLLDTYHLVPSHVYV